MENLTADHIEQEDPPSPQRTPSHMSIASEEPDQPEERQTAGEADDNAASTNVYQKLFESSFHLDAHSKLVTHIKFDPTYQRLVTGSTDHTIAFYDIHNMKSDLQPIRTLEPIDSQVVQSFD